MSIGIWFYGLSGSGKTYAANIVKSVIRNSYLIDGDDVCSIYKYRFKFTAYDRTKQIEEFLAGTTHHKKWTISVASSVFMDQKTFDKCDHLNVQVVR